MSFPLLHLAFTRTVPLVLALRATLCSNLAAIGAFRVVEELLEDIGVIKFHDPVHVLLDALLVVVKEFSDLVFGDLPPISVLHDLRPILGDLLHNKAVFRCDGAFLN